MMRMTILSVGAVLFAAQLGVANDEVELTSNVQATITQVWSSGDILPVVLNLEGGGSALFGGELEIDVATDDLSIRSVTFNPAFSAALGEETAEEDASSNGPVKGTGVQPLGEINHSLGADGSLVHFATVELEVLSDGPFESALIIKARGALVGEIPESTIVLGNASGPDGWGVDRIEIVNQREQGTGNGEQGTQPGGEQAAWNVEQAAATLEVWPVGGGAPVTVLAPNTEYELRVTGDRDTVNAFDLIITADSADVALPVFDLCWEGAEVVDLADSTAAAREAISADFVPVALDAQAASGAGEVLCHFTTPGGVDSAPYALTLVLRLYDIDSDARTTVEMPATGEYIVE